MSKTRDTGFLNNALKVDSNGNITLVSGSTTLFAVSSSGAVTTTGVISGSNALSASYALTASFVTLSQTASFVTTAQTASFVATAQTASFVTLAQTASFVTTAQTASFVANAQSASNAINAVTASSADSFLVRNTLTAQTIVVQTITSSVDFVTGSTRFGSLSENTHVFTGSVSISGSLTTSIAALGSAASLFLVSDGNVIKSRTAAQTLSDIAALPLTGGTLTGALIGTSATFGDIVTNTSGGFRTSVQQGYLLRNDANNASLGGFTRRSFWAGNAALDTQIFAETGYGIFLNVNGSSTTGMSIASTGAATFSSSVTATSAAFNTSVIVGNVSSLTGAWGNLTSVLQLGNSNTDKGYISVNEISGDDDINIVRYAYFDNTNWKRIGGGNPSRYSQRNAEHSFQYASSGADNSTITWNTALTLANTGAATFSSSVTATQSTNGEQKIEVANPNAGTDASAIINLANNSSVAQIVYNSSAYTGAYNFGANALTILNRASSSINFVTGGYTTANLRMTITSGGNVGIGATNPLCLLQAGGIGNSIVRLGTSSTTNNSSSSAFAAWNSSGGDILTVRGDGLVAFAKINDFTTGNSPNTWINPVSSYGIYINTSSIRYKRDIINYDKGLNVVSQLRPVYYKGKSEVDGDKQFAGFIAEEIDELGLTEFVNYLEDERPNSLSYPNMVALLTKAIQELKSENDSLKEILQRNNIV